MKRIVTDWWLIQRKKHVSWYIFIVKIIYILAEDWVGVSIYIVEAEEEEP